MVGTAFALIFPAELPDKTFLASLVLSTRFRALPVWLGVVAAFLVQCLLAVTAGGLIALLPRTPVLLAAAALFAFGSFVLFRGAGAGADEDAEAERAREEQRVGATAGAGSGTATPWRAGATSFLVLFLAEFGDLSQLLTAGLVVRLRDPVSVFLGSWLALATVAALAVLAGQTLLRRMRLSLLRGIGGSVCALLAVLTLIEALTG